MNCIIYSYFLISFCFPSNVRRKCNKLSTIITLFLKQYFKTVFFSIKIYDRSPKTYGKDKPKRFANWQNEIELVTVHRYPNRNEGSNISFGKSRSSMKHQVGVSGHCLLEWRFGGNSFRKEHTIYSLPTTAMFCDVLSRLR